MVVALTKRPATKVTIIDISPPSDLPQTVSFRQVSVLDPALPDHLTELRPDVVIHLAFTVNPTHKPSRAREVDIGGTRAVLEVAASVGVKHLIHISSSLTYGALPDNPALLTEESPLRARPTFHYPYHKRLVEEEVLPSFREKYPNIKLTVVRPCGFLGPDLSNYVANVLRGRLLPVMRGGGKTPIQFGHLEDIVDGIIAVVSSDQGGVFNLAPNDTMTMDEIAAFMPGRKVVVPEFLARLGIRLLWALRLYKAPPGYLDYVRHPFVADNSLAKEQLGWEPKYSTQEALQSLL